MDIILQLHPFAQCILAFFGGVIALLICLAILWYIFT